MIRGHEKLRQDDYPWYEAVSGDEIEQGDIFDNCPVFIPPDDLLLDSSDVPEILIEDRDVIVMSQTCDMSKKYPKITEVLLCPIWKKSEAPSPVSTLGGLENARKGKFPGLHLLNKCNLPSLGNEIRIVDFRRVYSLPLTYMRNIACNHKSRIRLLPPYREHLSQSFARFFMRVGLPSDIPAFK